jgi:MraZ protein
MAPSDVKEPGTNPPSATMPAAGYPRFTWRYEHQIDGQGRASLPSKWRPESTAGLTFMAVMIKHPSEAEFVMVLPMDQFERFINPICEGDFTAPLKLAERHDYVDRIIELELDSAGRIALPKEMRAAAQLKSDVMFVGCINRFELWNPKAYELARMSEQLLKKVQNPEKT